MKRFNNDCIIQFIHVPFISKQAAKSCFFFFFVFPVNNPCRNDHYYHEGGGYTHECILGSVRYRMPSCLRDHLIPCKKISKPVTPMYKYFRNSYKSSYDSKNGQDHKRNSH